MTQPTRIEAARGRAASAKELAVASAAAGFIAVLLLARAGHPGHSASSSSSPQQLAVDEPVAVRVQRRRQLRLRLGLYRSLDRRAGRRPRRVSPERRVFRSMGVDVLVCGATDDEHAAVRRLFDERDRVFSRFRAESELNRVNRDPSEVVVLSPLFAGALRTALGAAAATDGLVDPTLGARDRRRRLRPRLLRCSRDDERPLGPSVPGPLADAPPRRRACSPAARHRARPERRRQGARGRRRARADRRRRASSPPAATSPRAAGPSSALPGGGSLRLLARRDRDERHDEAALAPRGRLQHHLIDPRTGRPAASRWDEVTVAAGSCVAADVAAKAAFLLSKDGPGLARRARAARAASSPDGEVVVNGAWRGRSSSRRAA